MDIRKYFSNFTNDSVENHKKKKKKCSFPTNGLCRERQLNLTPTKKQCKKFNSKKTNALLLSSDESDGESPITGNLKKELNLKKKKKVILSDDEDYNLLSASTSKPLNNTSNNDKTKKNSLKKIPSLIESDDNCSRDGINLQIKRRTARKIINLDEEPVVEVFSKKRKANSKNCNLNEIEDEKEKEEKKATKRPKRSDETIVPMEIVNELFTNEKVKQKKKILKEKSKPLIDENKNLKDKKTINLPKKEIRFEISPTKKLKELHIKKEDNFLESSKTEKKVENKNFKNEIIKQNNVLTKQSSIDNLPWVEKYRPIQIKQLIGQHTEKSCLNKLIFWLKDWAKNNLNENATKKKVKPTGFQAQNDGTAFKAALLSGPPGIGKTSCAVLACKELGLSYVETNASDARNKKSIEKNVAGLLDSQSINQFFLNSTNVKKKEISQVLIMDEVDGMSGNQDRAGIAELILMIKRTKVPIVCICNDRQSTKIRSLANYCFDLRFQRPRVEQIMGRLLTIVAQERISIGKDCLQKIIEASNQDIRQCIHTLQLISSSSNQNCNQFQKKNIAMNIFDTSRRLLTKESNLMEKQELFFSDYSIMPLFVQDNYLNVRASHIGNAEHLRRIKLAAENIAFGDIIDKQIRSYGAWNLLVDEAMFSCAIPALIMDGHLTQQIQFPAWFGKNSNANKKQRLMRQLFLHASQKISGNNCALVSDYIPIMRDRMYRPLIDHDTAGVKDVVEFYTAYNLIKDDAEAINELGVWPSLNKGKKDFSLNVSTKAKSALTKALNKTNRLLPFAQQSFVKGSKRSNAKVETFEIDEEGHEILVGAEDDEDNETIAEN